MGCEQENGKKYPFVELQITDIGSDSEFFAKLSVLSFILLTQDKAAEMFYAKLKIFEKKGSKWAADQLKENFERLFQSYLNVHPDELKTLE